MINLPILALVVLSLTASGPYDTSPAFSPDGISIAFVRNSELDGSPVIVYSPVENPSLRILGPGINPQFNPDGLHILYLLESPDKEIPTAWTKQELSSSYTDICTMQVNTGEVKQLTRQGGTCPVWSADGGEIAYFSSSGALCSLPITGGSPKKIASKVPCRKCLTWLPDWKSFAVTQTVKAKMARYAFSPPSRTPVRISPEFNVPAEAIKPLLNEQGTKMAFIKRKQIPEENEAFAGLEIWAVWQGGKRKVADIPLASPLSMDDINRMSLAWSADSKLIAAACQGKVWVVELASGKLTCISDAAVAQKMEPETSSADSDTSGRENQGTGDSR